MRALTPVALSFLLVGCAPSRRAIIVEDSASIVGANRATTQALGIETLGGVFTPLIKQGTTVPCSVSEVFSTAADGQSQIIVSLFRGTEPLAARNHLLGRFQVVDIPNAPRGVPQVEITFAITERSISLSARDLTRRADLRIVRTSGDRNP
jgi:molecular chaperone DnaK